MRLQIVDCTDPQMWYSDMVGETVPYDRDGGDVYWAFEPTGYRNIVLKGDALLVDGGDH